MSRTSLIISLMLLLAAFVWLAQVVAGTVSRLPVLSVLLSAMTQGRNGTLGTGLVTAAPSAAPLTATPQVQDELLSSVVLLAVMLGFLIWRVRRNLPSDDGSLGGFLIFVTIAVVAFFTLLVSGRAMIDLIASLAQSHAGLDSPGGGIVGAAYVIAAGIAGVSLSSVLLSLWRGSRRRRSVPILAPGDTTSTEFTRSIRETVYAIRSGSDFRLAVLACYKSLCDTLQDRGADNPPELTAREFEVLAEKRLRINAENLRRITTLFEKARYSQDTIGEADAAEAEASLLSLEEEVRTRSATPGRFGP